MPRSEIDFLDDRLGSAVDDELRRVIATIRDDRDPRREPDPGSDLAKIVNSHLTEELSVGAAVNKPVLLLDAEVVSLGGQPEELDSWSKLHVVPAIHADLQAAEFFHHLLALEMREHLREL